LKHDLNFAHSLLTIFVVRSPQLGQGCNLALVDAEKLVDCLEKTFAEKVHTAEAYSPKESKVAVSPSLPEEQIPSALASYTATRWYDITISITQLHTLAVMFYHDHTILG
jgi:hypothetical protein